MKQSFFPSKVLRVVVFAASCLLVTSCTYRHPVHFYAVRGKAVQESPQLVGIATIQSPYRGSIKITWPDGETGTGQYSGIANFATTASGYSGYSSGSAYGTTGTRGITGSTYGPNGFTDFRGEIGGASVMYSTYQSVYGRSFTRSLAPGAIPIQGMLITDRGRRVEFIGSVGSGTNNGTGVATDSLGNTYRVIF
jgi:hypothetical protein